jgi:hypothetical protein
MHSHINRLMQNWKTMPLPDKMQTIFEFQFVINWFVDTGLMENLDEEQLWMEQPEEMIEGTEE